jgi:hypothetical protein
MNDKKLYLIEFLRFFASLIDTFKGLVESENYHSTQHFIFEDINFVQKKINKLNLHKTKVLS